MTVKCLNSLEKTLIVDSFLAGYQSIDEMATMYNRSRRTIIRVLEEQDVDPKIRRRNPPQPDRQQKLALKPVVINTKTPWYRKVYETVSRFGQGLVGLCA
jgi:transposase